MPLFKKFNEGSGVVGVWHMAEQEDELLHQLTAPYPYGEELKRFMAPKRRMEYLCVRVLLKTLLDGKELQIGYSPSGKPFLMDSGLHISLSHTHHHCAVIVHPAHEVGIDIEQRSERVKKVIRKFVRSDEIPHQDCLNDADLLTQYLLHWSAKETAYKVMGREGVDFLHDLQVLPFDVHVHDGRLQLLNTDSCCLDIGFHVHEEFVLTWTVKE